MEALKWERGKLRQDYRLITIRLNKEKDKDIIELLDTLGNNSGYIKSLIRNDMKEGE